MRLNSRWSYRVRAALREQAPAAASAADVPINAEWDEAFLRVESYLRAHRIESRILLNQLATEIIGSARKLAADHPKEPPVTLAMQVAHGRIGEWVCQNIGGGDWMDARFRARGRLALLLAGVPGRCPERFLRDELPDDLRSPLTSAELEPGPEVRLSRMPSNRLEFPLAEAVEANWVTFSRSAFLRGSMSWLFIAGMIGAAWFATR
jgi:hypothetical protein